jgi:CitMHS family citrate-Mg2+:H+ or citrate-Ca2+:H+ symporter
VLTLVGLATILTIVLALVTRKASPVVAMSVLPCLAALLLGHPLSDLGTFFTAGVSAVMPVVVMFVFAILFFGLMQDVGLFDPLLDGLVRLSGGNVVAVTVGTAALAMVAHLDGSGATTFLITVPALLPLYRRLRMDPYLMMLLLATGAGIFNMFPWAGPLGRAAAVIGVDAGELWRPLVPVQVAGAVLLLAMAAFLGMRERRRLAAGAPGDAGGEEPASREESLPHAATAPRPHARPERLAVNFLLTLVVVWVLITGALPPGLTFMLGVGVALPLNFTDPTEQRDRLQAHAPNALWMGAIILAAGCFLGVLEGTGMLKAIARDLVAVLPSSMAARLHLVLGVFGLPMDMLLSTDAYYFALLPVVNEIVAGHGVAATTSVYAMSIGNVIGAFVSPFSPALWLALGLAELEMGRHLRYALPWMWAYSVVLLGFAVLLGVIPVG